MTFRYFLPLLLFFCLVAGAHSAPLWAVTTPPVPSDGIAADWATLGDLPLTLTEAQAKAFSLTSRAELERQLGRRLRLSERFVFNYAKRKLRRDLRRGRTLDVPPINSSGMLIGILLVLVLGVLGLLIALILGNRTEAGIVQGAWLGMGISLALTLLLVGFLFLLFV